MRKSRLSHFIAASAALAALHGCGAPAELNQEQLGLSVTSAEGSFRDPRILPIHKPGGTSAIKTASGAHLNYYGGHVLSSVKVLAVFWGAAVDSTITSTMPGFYSAVVNSPYMDWLSEYDTSITPTGGGTGTNQHIGRGTFGGTYTISPAKTSGTISDTQIQTELNSQIKAGHLPAPDANTLYMVSFPKGMVINLGGSTSCSVFCAYHNTGTTASGQDLIYSVLPYMGSGSGCETGCGSGVLKDDSTSVASHELIESVTDPEIGLVTGSSISAPAAWYDETNGEIGDICNGQDGALPGTSYMVQTEWSNKTGKCQVTGGSGTCVPSCSGKSCGSDGCGGTCGTCPSGQSCSTAGTCTSSCTPSCSGKSCGSDGCGGTCGTCPSGQSCSSAGTCVGGGGSTCTHDKCTTGKKLKSTCDPCVQQICAADSYCCSGSWDSTCVSEVGSVCGETC